jgi:heavy metal sensor kinase
MIRSIRFTLTLWYAGIFTLILGAFGWALYQNVSSSLARDVDRELALRADGVANAIHSYWEAKRQAVAPGNWEGAPAGSLKEVAALGQFPALVRQWAEETGHLQAGRPAAVLDHNGRLLAVSSRYPIFAQATVEEALAAAEHRPIIFHTVSLAEGRTRLVTRPMVDGGVRFGFVQGAASLAGSDTSLARLRLWLWWLIPFTLLLIGTVGWFLTDKALQPVDAMVRMAQHISAQRLEERLVVPKTGDELERLAITINDMLGRLERAFKRLRQFSAAASHELRTPLTVMKGELEVTLRRPRETEEYRQTLETHLKTIDEMTHTVEELLMLARGEAVDSAVEWKPVNITDLLHEAIKPWQVLAAGKGLKIQIHADGPAWVRGERRLLERIITNLTDNAVRHLGEHGVVTISVDKGHGQVRLRVQDNGPGIPPEELSQLFDRFFKPRSGSANGGGGAAGLGLGLCRWIAEVHRGRIEASSAEGQGATFTVWLPMHQA